MNQIINSIINFLNGPMYWDSASFLSHAAILTSKTGNWFAYINAGSSDYPHTPLLVWSYALIFKILGPEYWRIGARLLSYSFAFILLFIGYKIIYLYTKNKINAILIQLLIISDPIFWNQMYLGYFEIPSLLFRILALINAVQGNWRKYLFWGIIAIGIRFDNTLYFFMTGVILLFANTKERKKTVTASIILTLAGMSWILFHKVTTGWWLFSPTYGFDNSIASTTTQAYSIFLNPFRKNLFFIAVLSSLLSFKNKELIKIILISFILIGTNFIISITTYPLIRYFIPTFWMLRMLIGVVVTTQYSKKISSLIIMLVILWGIITRDMYTTFGNGEEMLGLVKELKTKKEFYSQIYAKVKEEPILVDYPENLEMTSPEYGFVNKSMKFKPLNIYREYEKTNYCYILVTPTSHQVEKVVKSNLSKLILLEQKKSKLGTYQLYTRIICQ